jgi:hypothetical protein
MLACAAVPAASMARAASINFCRVRALRRSDRESGTRSAAAGSRARSEQRTRDYLDHRTTQGSTRREAIRCLKRYVAREIYRLIQQLNPADQTLRTA